MSSTVLHVVLELSRDNVANVRFVVCKTLRACHSAANSSSDKVKNYFNFKKII